MATEDMELEKLIITSNSFEKQALDLVVENEALKAMVNYLRGQLGVIENFQDDWGVIESKTPEQCLDNVKADAIDGALSLILSVSDGDMCFDILTERVNELRNS